MRFLTLTLTTLAILAQLLHADGQEEFQKGIFGTQYHESFGLVWCPDNTLVKIPRFGLPTPKDANNDSLYEKIPTFNNPDGDYLPFPEDGVMDSPILALRFQDKLLTRGRDRKPANFNWQENRISDTSSADVEAAIVFDLYTPGIAGTRLFDYDPSAAAFRTSAGVGWERNTAPGSERDVRSFYLGTEFDFFPRFLEKRNVRSRQPVGIGLIYEQDVLGGEERLHLDLDYTPVTGLLREIFGDDNSTLWIGRRSYFKGFFDLVDQDKINIEASTAPEVAGSVSQETSGEAKKGSRSYFYLRPDLGLELGGGAQLGDVIDGFSDGFFRYGFETGLGFRDDLVKLTYRFEGLTPLSSANTSHTFHEVSLDFSARRLPVTVSASYQRGRRSPDFAEEDLVKLGLTYKL